MFADTDLDDALTTLGELLTDQGESYDLIVIGGGALLLQGLIERPTEDLDVVARLEGDTWLSAKPFPDILTALVIEVADALDLARNWLNHGPAELLMRAGLPDGFIERLEKRTYGSLTVRFAAREDQIAFKLDAAADHLPDESKHLMDLRRLAPSGAELQEARAWCAAHRGAQRQHDLDEVIAICLGLFDD